MVNLIKNIAIIVDFVISMIGGIIQKSAPEVSGVLINIGIVALVVALVCVIIDFCTKKKDK